jgi:hypothetical protein
MAVTDRLINKNDQEAQRCHHISPKIWHVLNTKFLAKEKYASLKIFTKFGSQFGLHFIDIWTKCLT